MGSPSKPLSERERRFVEAYMGKAAGNGTDAARLAGYKGNSNVLRVQASRLLAKANVQAAVAERVQRDPQIADRERLQRFWTAVAMGDAVYRDASLRDRLKASELLGKSQAAFVEKHEHAGTDGAPIKVVFGGRYRQSGEKA